MAAVARTYVSAYEVARYVVVLQLEINGIRMTWPVPAAESVRCACHAGRLRQGGAGGVRVHVVGQHLVNDYARGREDVCRRQLLSLRSMKHRYTNVYERTTTIATTHSYTAYSVSSVVFMAVASVKRILVLHGTKPDGRIHRGSKPAP